MQAWRSYLLSVFCCSTSYRGNWSILCVTQLNFIIIFIPFIDLLFSACCEVVLVLERHAWVSMSAVHKRLVLGTELLRAVQKKFCQLSQRSESCSSCLFIYVQWFCLLISLSHMGFELENKRVQET